MLKVFFFYIIIGCVASLSLANLACLGQIYGLILPLHPTLRHHNLCRNHVLNGKKTVAFNIKCWLAEDERMDFCRYGSFKKYQVNLHLMAHVAPK